MTGGFVWTSPPDEVFPQLLAAQEQAIYEAIGQLADFFAPQIEAWMKTNASWTDQTGNARQSLHTDVVKMTGQVVIFLRHGVSYGYWLEVANQGRYSIILPALDYWAPKIWEAVKALLS